MSTIAPSSNTENETVTKPPSDTVLNGDKKEEESPSTEPQQNKENEASVANSADNQNEKELLKQGQTLIQEDNYNEAASVLATAMELIQQKDIANCIDAVPYYLSYGEALLRLVQSCNDLFAAPVRQSQQQHLQELQNEEEAEEPAAAELISDATTEPVQPTDATNDDQETTEKIANGKEEVDDDEDDDLQQNGVESAGDIEPRGGDVDTTDDREIAWESFEYARGIIEDYLSQNEQGKDEENSGNDKYYEMLSRCHSFLGELLIEDENSEMALDEFEKALEIQDKCSSDYIKYRQRAFNHFMACLSAQYAQKDEVALKHCNISLRRSSERICDVLMGMGCTEEMKQNDDYQVVMKVAEEFMDKMDDKEKVQELKELVGIMQDLMSKVDEVEQVIEAKKNQVVNNGDNGDVGGLMDAQDPLQALINGLVGKFGIDEDVLGEEDGGDGNDGNRNNGVTTIGFGNFGGDEDGDDEEVNDLGCFGKKKVERKAGKKRSMEDAEIVDDEVNAKKMRLNTGDAAVVENENEEAKK